MKTIIYTNSKQQAEGAITKMAEDVLAKSENRHAEVLALTGGDGLQMKIMTTHAFARNITEDVDDVEDDGDAVRLLPRLLIMPATKAADCGVSSVFCKRSYRIGVAPSM